MAFTRVTSRAAGAHVHEPCRTGVLAPAYGDQGGWSRATGPRVWVICIRVISLRPYRAGARLSDERRARAGADSSPDSERSRCGNKKQQIGGMVCDVADLAEIGIGQIDQRTHGVHPDGWGMLAAARWALSHFTN